MERRHPLLLAESTSETKSQGVSSSNNEKGNKCLKYKAVGLQPDKLIHRKPAELREFQINFNKQEGRIPNYQQDESQTRVWNQNCRLTL